jgi:hypothetical protein
MYNLFDGRFPADRELLTRNLLQKDDAHLSCGRHAKPQLAVADDDQLDAILLAALQRLLLDSPSTGFEAGKIALRFVEF